MTNEDLFTLYDNDLVLRLHNVKNLSDTRKMLTKFKEYLNSYPPSPEHATKILQLLHEDTPVTMTISDKNSASPGRGTDIAGKVTEAKHAGEANFRERCKAPQSNREAADLAAGLASDEVVARQLPRELPKKGERYWEA